MHKHPRRDRGLASVMAMLAPIALLLMVAIVPIHIGSRSSMAALPSGPLVVDGNVSSSTGSPVSGANVVVTVKNGSTVIIILPTTSDSNGFYTVTVDHGFWGVGYTILVEAAKGSDVGQNSTEITDPDAFGMTVDVKLGTTGIPELGGPAMTALTVSAIGMMVVFFARRSRSLSP